MQKKANILIKNFSYTITANIISLLISVLVILIVPKLIGVIDYSFWQLYLFYASYVGFLQLGWNDGIYLRYGGYEYKNLDKKIFFSQFWMLMLSQIIIAILVMSPVFFWGIDPDRMFVIYMVLLCTIIMGTRSMLVFILQATNKIREYSLVTVTDRILYCFLIALFLLCGVRNYEWLVTADIIGKGVSLIYVMYICRDIVFQKISAFSYSFKETYKNISVGIKLMFANIASMLIIGVVRFGIERAWSISTFGKVSLTLSISNFLMIFINAVGIIIYPLLRKTNEKNLPHIYIALRDFLMLILFATLILYFPLYTILSAWLPKYTDSLNYMAFLFPMCVYEGKTALLTNTYFKALRKEKIMLKINLIILGLSIIFTYLSTVYFENLNLSILSVVILLALRSIFAEVFLTKLLDISVVKDIFIESGMTVIFILVAVNLNIKGAVLLYCISYLFYLTIKRSDILNVYKFIHTLFKSN